MNDTLQISTLLSQIPSIKVKSIIDFTNIPFANSDILRTRTTRTFLGNVVASITGKNNREINLLLENFSEQLNCTMEYIEYFLRCETANLYAINALAGYISETRSAVISLGEGIPTKFSEIENRINETKTHLEKSIQRVDRNVRAQSEIEEEFNKLNLGIFDAYSPAERLKIVLENIYYGTAGNVLLSLVDDDSDSYRQPLILKIRANSNAYLKSLFASDIFFRRDIFCRDGVTQAPKPEIEYLFNYHHPIARAIWQANRHSPEKVISQKYDDPMLPFIFNRDVFTVCLLNEFTLNRNYFYE